MKNFDGMGNTRRERTGVPQRVGRTLALLLALICCAGGASVFGQAVESANEAHASLWVGGGASGYYLQYGSIKELGITGLVDFDTTRRFGVEAEGRWLEYHKTANVHVETYAAGLRYHFNMGRFQPYAKGLVGGGRFNFPYNYAYGNYFLIAPGAGVDYRLSRRWSMRVADFEYQYWPQFTFGAMSSAGITTGIRYRVF